MFDKTNNDIISEKIIKYFNEIKTENSFNTKILLLDKIMKNYEKLNLSTLNEDILIKIHENIIINCNEIYNSPNIENQNKIKVISYVKILNKKIEEHFANNKENLVDFYNDKIINILKDGDIKEYFISIRNVLNNNLFLQQLNNVLNLQKRIDNEKNESEIQKK